MASGEVERIKATLKRATGVLNDAGIPFLLGGGLASWARGGPESGHDVDLMMRKEDVEPALDALARAGMRIERPPEGWLVKAYDGTGEAEVLIDLVYEPSGVPIDTDMIARSDAMEVLAVPMRVMALEDLLVTKLAALQEHELHYDGILEIARALRERIDWDDVRARAPANPYVRAFFTLVEELGVAPFRGS